MPAKIGKCQLASGKRRMVVTHHDRQWLVPKRLIVITRGFIADYRAADHQIQPPFIKQRQHPRARVLHDFYR